MNRMNKYPERKYDSIIDLLKDGNLPQEIRTSSEIVYNYMTKDKNKYALKQCTDMVNYYINNNDPSARLLE